MDGQRFDDVARLIGTGASRRRVIKGIFGSVLGLSGVGVARQMAGAQEAQGSPCVLTGDACADDGDPCCGDSVCAGVPRMCYSTTSCVGGTGGCNTETGPACCSGLECVVTDGANGTCVACGQLTDGCDTADDCCGDLICVTGACAEEAPVCAAVTESCDTSDDCCEDLVCTDFVCVVPVVVCETDAACANDAICCDDGDGGVCVTRECCGADDPIHCDNETQFCTDEGICVLLEGRDECQEDSDCFIINGESEIPPICCGGVCANIECCTDDENPNARCEEGTSCYEGYCDPYCSNDSECPEDTCCCPDGSCYGECCDSTEEPAEEEEYEVPMTLPNTGAGQDSGTSGLLGAGLLAAGAAYLAGKKLKDAAES